MALLIHEKTKEVYNCPDSFLNQLGDNLPASRGLISHYLTDEGYNRLQMELAGNDFGARMKSQNWSGYQLYEVRRQERSFEEVKPGRVALNIEYNFLKGPDDKGEGDLVLRIKPFILESQKKCLKEEEEEDFFDYCLNSEEKNSF